MLMLLTSQGFYGSPPNQNNILRIAPRIADAAGAFLSLTHSLTATPQLPPSSGDTTCIKESVFCLGVWT